ncbi:acyl-CoA reductase [Lysinibacillus sp. NPDC058147]|uniref:acyl-CoA reductase n=1 Tax=unclassified Lysinibacillus TaxID=2636778 RepID=UPI0036DD4A71
MIVFWPTNQSFDQALAALQVTKVLPLFDEEVLAFANYLSKQWLRMRSQPEIVALGYWLRKSNIKEMQDQFREKNAKSIKVARGTVFHIAPSNVDTIFVYSWLLSLFAGNRNIIRLSGKSQDNVLLTTIIEAFHTGKFNTIAKQTILCTYNHDEGATEKISEICHTRVIWGGDTTIKEIRQVPLAPLANELAFPDRFSVALLNSEALDDIEVIVKKFYNDAFWFDQMACSSPRLIFWLGNNTKAIEQFWRSLDQHIKSEQYEFQSALQVTKLTTAMQYATDKATDNVSLAPTFIRIQVTGMDIELREQHCGAGLFLECSVQSLEEIADKLADKDQTLSYYGVSKEELAVLVNAISNRAIDRIVPIGQALNFSNIWDGQQFLTSYTRKVVIL